MGRWEVAGSRRVYDSPWVAVDLVDVTTPDGRRIPEHHVVRAPLQVGGLLAHDAEADALLLLWRHRFIGDHWGWEVPAGRAEPGEALPDAAARECLEETGWRPVGPVRPLATWRPSAGLLDQVFHAYAADGAVHEGPPSDPSEAARVAWLPVDEVAALLDAGEVVDGFSVVALHAWLRQAGR